MSVGLLSLVVWLPIAAGVAVLATGGDRNAGLARALALVGALAGLAVSLPLYTQFDTLQAGMQFVEISPWIETFKVTYHLGVDGISVLFILLTSFTTLLAVIAGWRVMLPTGTRPGQRMIAGTLMPPSHNENFCPVKGQL